ncbi:MAG: hypothetical protein ACRDZ8_18540 [Acidimicrobiales bacterium]
MRIFRRWGALGLSALLIGTALSTIALTAGAAAPAAAQNATPEAFAGSASAQALTLSLLGINLNVDKTDAAADSSPKASADAAVLAPGSLLTLDPTKVAVPTSAANTTDATPVCNGALALSTLISITAVCAQSAAAIPPDAAPAACAAPSGAVTPMACSSAKVLEIDVGLTQLLQPILTAVKNSLQGVSTTVGNILSNLPVVSPLLNNLLNSPLLSGLGIKLSDPVSSLLDALNRATELLSVKVLPSVSAVSTTAGAVTAAAEADGIVVTLLPGVLLNSQPLLDLHVAEGQAISTYNRTTCASTSQFTAGLLSGELLGTPLNVSTSTISLGGLGSISLGNGTKTSSSSAGTASATADGLAINLLNGLVVLDAGHATSSIGGNCAVAAPAPTTTTSTSTVAVAATTVTKPPVLATTGADEAPLLPIGFLLLLAGYLTRRRWLSRRSQTSK